MFNEKTPALERKVAANGKRSKKAGSARVPCLYFLIPNQKNETG
jgi:hypothetical protein